MKSVKVEWQLSSKPTSRYASDGVSFSWLGIPKNNVFPQIAGWHGCRETFIGEFKRSVDSVDPKFKYKINASRMRFAVLRKYNKASIKPDLIKRKNSYDTDWMNNAVRILNLFEKRMGWTLTSASQVEGHSLETDGCNIFVFTASCKWLHGPQLISLYLLLLRLSRIKVFKDIKSLDDLPKIFKDSAKSSNTDIGHFRTIHKYLLPIIDDCKDLFLKRSIKTAFKSQAAWQGITSLIGCQADPVTYKKFKKLKSMVDNTVESNA